MKSKLLYALETLEIPAGLRSLEAFQLKGLRKILGMASTFFSIVPIPTQKCSEEQLHISRNNLGSKLVPKKP